MPYPAKKAPSSIPESQTLTDIAAADRPWTDDSPQWETEQADLEMDRTHDQVLIQETFREHAACGGRRHHELRSELVRLVSTSYDRDAAIDTVIHLAVDSSADGRLDLGIDILSNLGAELYDYALTYRRQDVKRATSTETAKAYQPNEDYWYILLRAVAQSSVSDDDKLQLVRSCQQGSTPGILEAVVESLGDIWTEGARQVLRGLTRNPNSSIADLAQTVLDD